MNQASDAVNILAAVLLGIGALLVLIAYLRRHLDWREIGISRLEPAQKLIWDGLTLARPYTCRVRIQNTGSRKIKSSEVEGPLVLVFGSGTCHGATVTRKSIDNPMRLGSVYRSPTSTVEIPLETLNGSRWFDIDMLVDGPEGYPKVYVSIPGVRAMRNATVAAVRRYLRLGVALIILGMVSTIGLGVLSYKEIDILNPGLLGIAEGLSLGLALCGLALLSHTNFVREEGISRIADSFGGPYEMEAL